jgi:hypothetical protein
MFASLEVNGRTTLPFQCGGISGLGGFHETQGHSGRIAE